MWVGRQWSWTVSWGLSDWVGEKRKGGEKKKEILFGTLKES